MFLCINEYEYKYVQNPIYITILQTLTHRAFLGNNSKGEPLPLSFFGLSFRSPVLFTFRPKG